MFHFAIIGCGRIAWRHAEQIARVGKLVAVCDVVGEKAEALATDFGAKAYTSIDDLLQSEKEVQVVAVCTPNGLHAEHTIKSLQGGRHVLCEKPMCLTKEAAYSMRDTAHFFRRQLFIVKSARFNPLLQTLKSWIDAGKLGRLYSFQLNCFWHRPDSYFTDWHGTKDLDGGPLYTQFSHYIDAMLWLFGTINEAKGFSANAAHHDKIEFEDTGVATMHFDSGLLGSLSWSLNAFKKNNEIALTLIAEKGTIVIGGEYLNQVNYCQLAEDLHWLDVATLPNNYPDYKGSMSHHAEVYDQLIIALQHAKHQLTNPTDGLETVMAIEKIYNSIVPISTNN